MVDLGSAFLESHPSPRPVLVPVFVLMLAVLAGCSGTSGGPATKSTTTEVKQAATTTAAATSTSAAPATTMSPPTTVDAITEDKADITKLYNGWVELRRTIVERDDPSLDYQRLGKYFTGIQLQHAVDILKKRDAAGKKVTYPDPSVATSEVLSISVDGNVAILTTCEVNDSIVAFANGDVEDASVVTSKDQWTLIRKDGKDWRISMSSRLEKFDGVQSCS